MKALYLKYLVRSVPKDIDLEYHTILTRHSSYYGFLNEKLKCKFRLRLYRLLNILAFGSQEFRVVTREMRVVIGTSIIEITFGLDKYLPARFTNIIVMPYRYMYPGFGEPFLGHIDYDTNTIYFSWKDVQEGYFVADDAVNVALHEMAHMIEAENQFGQIYSKFFSVMDWNKWAEQAFAKMKTIRKGENVFLREYGGINMREMFAVCIEAFFEQPVRFRAQLPEIYASMVTLLKQDTAAMREK